MYVIWDLETDSADTNFLTILEIGAIKLDQNFNEIDRFSARCRIPTDRVPSATALCINQTNLELLTKTNLSHYDFLNMIEKKFQSFSPATFLAYSGINFDSEALRKEFFKSLKKPYLENTNGNLRHDALNIVRGAFAVDEKIINAELNLKGNISMKLESLSKANNFDVKTSHTAMTDTENCVDILKLIRKRRPEIFQACFKTSSKQMVENIVLKEKIITLNEYFYGKSRLYLCSGLHPNSFIHPVYQWAIVFDLRVNPEPLFDLSFNDLKKEMKKTPKFLRTVRSNKAPIIFDPEYGMSAEPYKSIDQDLIKKRAEMIRNNEKFAKLVCSILEENAIEKNEASSQVDQEIEETLYTGGFGLLNKDQGLFKIWHESDWKKKLSMLDKFQDDRNIKFAQQIIFNEAPDVLPDNLKRKIKRKIASRILSLNKEKWYTVSACYKEIDDIRENEDLMFSFQNKKEKLNFLDGIDGYVKKLEKIYSDA